MARYELIAETLRHEPKAFPEMEQRSPEWYQVRKGRISASMIGAILGHSPWRTANDVLVEMLRNHHGIEVPTVKTSQAVEWGIANEDEALRAYQMEYDAELVRPGYITRGPVAGCSPDAMGANMTFGVEVKCPYSKRNIQTAEDFKPLHEQPHYVDQVQWSLLVSGAAHWHFVQWAPGALLVEPVDVDQEWRKKNLPRIEAFYQRYLDMRNTEEGLRIAKSGVVPVNSNDYLEEFLEDYQYKAEQAAGWAKDKDEALARLLQSADGKEVTFVNGAKLARTERKGAINWKRVQADHLKDVDVEAYRADPVSFWQVRG